MQESQATTSKPNDDTQEVASAAIEESKKPKEKKIYTQSEFDAALKHSIEERENSLVAEKEKSELDQYVGNVETTITNKKFIAVLRKLNVPNEALYYLKDDDKSLVTPVRDKDGKEAGLYNSTSLWAKIRKESVKHAKTK